MLTRTLNELILEQAARRPEEVALIAQGIEKTYAEFAGACQRVATFLHSLGVPHGSRVAVFGGKTFQTVEAMFGTSLAGSIFVPINPVLKSHQVKHILQDSGALVLISDAQRAASLLPLARELPSLKHVILTSGTLVNEVPGILVHDWSRLEDCGNCSTRLDVQESSIASILYTSGSTGRPKGVVLSHANMTVGALSVSAYIENVPEDRILSLLPLSFDAGLSQLTTAFAAGAQLILLDYLLPQDVVKAASRYGVTGITGVPPLWHQLVTAKWDRVSSENLRYWANTGGRMPRGLLDTLRKVFPKAKPFLMYGLTEAFRSTFLDPAQVDTRPDSIGKAIPNVRIDVINANGQPCKPDEKGELVHSGPLVALGYWNDSERTSERFKPAPWAPSGLPHPPMAVWSGDQVTLDEEGYLYFVGREDEMIKSSGYRISPTEVEEIVGMHEQVDEVAAFGLPDESLGQIVAIVVSFLQPGESGMGAEKLLHDLRGSMPAFMLPKRIMEVASLPRNANGKIDRTLLKAKLIGAVDD